MSDDGFLVDPESSRGYFSRSAVALDSLTHIPVLGLLGEPGIGKSTVIKQEVRRLAAQLEGTDDFVLLVDLTAYASDVLVFRAVFESELFEAWQRGQGRLRLLLDGFDTCPHNVESLVALFLEGLRNAPRDRLFVLIACRTADWPEDLEAGLRELWLEYSSDESPDPVGTFELAPLRKGDAHAVAEASGIGGDSFLAEVHRAEASQFANRPLTLRFLLDCFQSEKTLPSRKLIVPPRAHRSER